MQKDTTIVAKSERVRGIAGFCEITFPNDVESEYRGLSADLRYSGLTDCSLIAMTCIGHSGRSIDACPRAYAFALNEVRQDIRRRNQEEQ